MPEFLQKFKDKFISNRDDIADEYYESFSIKKPANHTLTSVSFDLSGLNIAFNVPLNVHSGSMKVIYNPEDKKAQIEYNLFGDNKQNSDHKGRWEILEEVANEKLFIGFENYGYSCSKNKNGITINIEIDEETDGTKIDEILNKFNLLKFGSYKPDELLKAKIEKFKGERKKYIDLIPGSLAHELLPKKTSPTKAKPKLSIDTKTPEYQPPPTPKSSKKKPGAQKI